MFFDIFLTLFLVGLNGFFVAAEFAIVKVRLSQIELIARKGNKKAPIAKKILTNLDTYLSATQLGITLASLGLGWIGEPVVSKLIKSSLYFIGISMEQSIVESISLPIAFLTITILHIVFGELAPKSIAIRKSEKTTLLTAGPLFIFFWLFSPLIWILNGFSNLILKLIGIHPVKEMELHSSAELLFIVDEIRKKGFIKEDSYNIIKRSFDFSKRTVKQIIIPRTRMYAYNIETPQDELIKTIIDSGFSRVPIYKENHDNIVGIINTKDLLNILFKDEKTDLTSLLRPVHFIPETKKIIDVLRDFQRHHSQIGIVTNEYGGTEGIVTMEDILEELVGEIQDEFDEEKPKLEKVDENTFIASGQTPIYDLNEQLPEPITIEKDYDTLSGLISYKSGKIPNVNESFIFDNYEFIILNRFRNRIVSVKIKHLKKDDLTLETK
jgi:CBS domain containing-hemolysin-like protein